MTDPFKGTIFEGMDPADFVIHSYTLDQAVDDGMLIKMWEQHWPTMSSHKPIIATANVVGMFSEAAIIEVWNEFVAWRTNIRDTLPEEDQMFETKMNDERVWVIEDGAAFTILLPQDY